MVKHKKNDIDKYNKPFPTILRKHLEAPGMTQQLLADYVGVKRQTVSQWKNGETTPDIESLSKIADFFGVNTDYLIGRVESSTVNIEIRAIHEKTGLSEKAIENICRLSSIKLYEGSGTFLTNGDFLNALLESEIMKAVLLGMSEAISTKSQYFNSKEDRDHNCQGPDTKDMEDVYVAFWKLEHTTKAWIKRVLKNIYSQYEDALYNIYFERYHIYLESAEGNFDEEAELERLERELRRFELVEN